MAAQTLTTRSSFHFPRVKRPSLLPSSGAKLLVVQKAVHTPIQYGRPALGVARSFLTIQKAVHTTQVFYPYLSTGGGSHFNTKYVFYDSGDWLASRHLHGDLTGVYRSPIYNIGSSGRYLVYILADIVIIGTGTTWAAKFPSPTTWLAGGATTLSWNDIFELPEGPAVTMKLYYGETSPPTSFVGKMEILSAIVTGQYFQVEITIADPTTNVYAYVSDFTLKFCQ